MANNNLNDRSVTRTYRTAIRIGEDFITLEETITLPIDADDDEVRRAVDLGWRIYQAQRDAVEQQITTIREAQPLPAAFIMRDPDAPASEKQRNYIAALQDDLAWTNEQLATHAGEQGVDLVTMTKGQASQFIDTLKKLSEDRTRYQATPAAPATPAAAPADDATPVTERQQRALAKLAQERGLDLDDEVQRRYGVAVAALSDTQARTLLNEWQRAARTSNGRRASEPAL